MIKGVIAGLAGISLTLMTASGNPLQGEAYGLRALSACIIGGLGFGGWGSMACAVFGAGFLVMIQSTVYYFFNLLYRLIPGFTVTSYWQNLVSDIIIFLGLLMTIVTAKGQREALKQGFVKQFKGGESVA
jgi:ribose/xylose/arabinose/galactoside ABC-type transport system permease subunit